jgi:hypothetical protein
MAAKKRASGQKGKQAAGTARAAASRRKSRATTKRMTGVTLPRKGAGEMAGEALGEAFGAIGNMMVPMKQIHDAYRQLSKKGRATGKKKK